MKNKNCFRNLGLFFSLFLVGFQTACHFWDLVNWDNPDAVSDTMGLSDKFCFDYLVLSNQYDIFCNKDSSPEQANFSGLLTNEGEGYAHDVHLILVFGFSYPTDPYCEFDFAEIGPGESVPLLCQASVAECADNMPVKIDTGACDYNSYTGHLDWLATQSPVPRTEPEDSEAPEDTEPFSLVEENIALLRQEWVRAVEAHPCDPQGAQTAFDAWLLGQATAWSGELGGAVGEGLQWPDMAAFTAWLTAQAGLEALPPVIKTWTGTFELTTAATVNCGACVPPAFTGTIEFSLPLDTCILSGSLHGSGAGSEVRAACDQENLLPCAGTGSYTLNAALDGYADSAGGLVLEDTTGSFKGTITWEGAGCTGDTGTNPNSSFEHAFRITGHLAWSGAASGQIEDISQRLCAHSGTWTANPVEPQAGE